MRRIISDSGGTPAPAPDQGRASSQTHLMNRLKPRQPSILLADSAEALWYALAGRCALICFARVLTLLGIVIAWRSVRSDAGGGYGARQEVIDPHQLAG